MGDRFLALATCEGDEVEGATYFRQGGKPDVAIAAILSEERWRENRFRTTLSHELAHVVLHGHLWAVEAPSVQLFPEETDAPAPARCFRSNILGATCEAHKQGGVSENTWLVGEEIFTPNIPGDALRYMDDPTADADQYSNGMSSTDYYPERLRVPSGQQPPA